MRRREVSTRTATGKQSRNQEPGEVGKLADLTVLDKDLLTVEPKEILTTRAVYTIVGGKVRYERK